MAHLAALKVAANADLAQTANKDSDFMNSSYGKEYQKQLDAYNERKSAYIKSRGWSEDSLSQASGETKRKKYYTGAGRNAHDRGPRYKSISVSRQEVVDREVGTAPSAANYLKDWKNAGKPSYRANDSVPDNSTQDNAGASSGSGTSNSADNSNAVKKGYDLQGSRYGRRQDAAYATDAGGGTAAPQGDRDSLGTGTLAGDRLKKRYSPLGK